MFNINVNIINILIKKVKNLIMEKIQQIIKHLKECVTGRIHVYIEVDSSLVEHYKIYTEKHKFKK